MTTELSLTDSTPSTSTDPSSSDFHLASVENWAASSCTTSSARSTSYVARHADVDHRARPAAGLVAHHLDLAVGHDVHDPVDVPQHHHPKGHLLDRAALTRRLDHVADRELVLEQNEEARDDVLDQALRAERDGQAQNAGAGQDRPDVDEDVEGEEDGDRTMTTPAHAPQQLGDGLAPAVPAVVVESSPSSTDFSIRGAKPHHPVGEKREQPDDDDPDG